MDQRTLNTLARDLHLSTCCVCVALLGFASLTSRSLSLQHRFDSRLGPSVPAQTVGYSCRVSEEARGVQPPLRFVHFTRVAVGGFLRADTVSLLLVYGDVRAVLLSSSFSLHTGWMLSEHTEEAEEAI